jgi:hypothetical protein
VRYQQMPEGVYRDVALDGTAVHGAHSHARMSRCAACVGVPAGVFDAAFRQSMVALTAMTLLLLSIGGGGTYVLSRQISREISQAAEGATRLGLN